MAYCTQQDMVTRFSETELLQLTDRQNIGVIDAVVLNQAINDASAEIDGYLSQYPLPLAFVPDVLIRVGCDIARYYLYDDAMIEQVQKRYDAVIRYLEQVAKGTIKLNTGVVDVPVANNTAQFQSAGSVFSRTPPTKTGRYYD